MKLLVLGISGRTGNLVAREALKRGFKVTGIARDKSKVRIDGAEIVEGTPYDIETVRTAIDGCEAVVSTLSLFPASQGIFSRIKTPLDVMSVSIQNVVTLMKEKGIKRIVLMTALGVGDSAREIPWLFSLFMKMSNIRHAYADHALQEKILEDSGLDWTIVRPAMLTDKNEDVSVLYKIKDEGKLKTYISRNAVANFILDAIEKGEFIEQKPGVSNK
ncbi:MAG: NAD(P)H-binding protein [Bacteroidales bacterium]|jgi:putative NADH-flavin reductase